jgi:hypothetical protein
MCDRPDDVPFRPDDVLKQKDFSAEISEDLFVQLSFRTAHVHRPDGAQVYFAWRSFEPPAYK